MTTFDNHVTTWLTTFALVAVTIFDDFDNSWWQPWLAWLSKQTLSPRQPTDNFLVVSVVTQSCHSDNHMTTLTTCGDNLGPLGCQNRHRPRDNPLTTFGLSVLSPKVVTVTTFVDNLSSGGCQNRHRPRDNPDNPKVVILTTRWQLYDNLAFCVYTGFAVLRH